MLTSQFIRILNWKVRGIDNKLSNLPAFLNKHDIHVAILTETCRTINRTDHVTTSQSDGYTFYFSSRSNTGNSSFFLDAHLREWGVCLAIKDGLAFQHILSPPHFNARLLEGTLTVPNSTGTTLMLHIFAVYAPANSNQKREFWDHLAEHVTSTGSRLLAEFNNHLVLDGDWNSHRDTDTNIYWAMLPPQTNNTMTLLNADASRLPKDPYTCRNLDGFIKHLRSSSIPVFDPIAKAGWHAFKRYTFANSKLTFRSILDKIFTSFPLKHMEPTEVLEWDQYKDVGLSDHRATISQISLSSLGNSWIEFPETPFRPSLPINIDHLKAADMSKLETLINEWKGNLPASAAKGLLEPGPNVPRSDHPTDGNLVSEIYSYLLKLCNDIPRSIISSDLARSKRIYKSAAARQAQHAVVWLRCYKVCLRHLQDARARGLQSLEKSVRRTIRRTYADFDSDLQLRHTLSDICPLLPRTNWTEVSWQIAWDKASALHQTWSHLLSSKLLPAKHAWLAHRNEFAYSKAPNSWKRRSLHFNYKNAATPLSSVMKAPTDPTRLVTGSEVNELWGSSAAAAKPNTMPPDRSKSPEAAPWLAPHIWTELRSHIKAREQSIMSPLTLDDLQTFLSFHTSRSSPGLDGV
jgi:hypothetical protein